jgi:hypothetical protein
LLAGEASAKCAPASKATLGEKYLEEPREVVSLEVQEGASLHSPPPKSVSVHLVEAGLGKW